MNPEIIIILPVHNRIEITKKFLDRLNAQTYKNYHLILVDDGCKDGTAEMTQKMIANVTVLKGNGDLWWAGALQLAYEYLRKKREFKDDDIVLIMNDDVLFSSNFFEIAVKTFNENNDKKILVPSIAVDNSNGKRDKAGVYYNKKEFIFLPTDEIDEINCLSTRGLFLRFTDFISSGGFYPKLLPHYFSDYEFTIRLIKKGFKPVVCKDLILTAFFENSGIDCAMKDLGICEYFRVLFSKRNKTNPIYRIFSVMLTISFPYNIFQTLRIIVRETFLVIKNILYNFRKTILKKRK